MFTNTFTKYFGLFLIMGSIVIIFLFTKVFYSLIVLAGEPFSSILISIPALSATFFPGIYFYKIGSIRKNSEDQKIKLTKIAAIIFVISILIIPMEAFIVFMVYGTGNRSCEGCELPIFFFGVFPAMIMSGVAVILLIIHWLKNRGLKYKQ